MLAFDGNTAPYLLYAYTRIQSVLKKAQIELHMQNINQDKLKIAEYAEHKLALHIAKFVDIMYLTAKESNPHYVCLYLYNLAGLFMQFYESCPILKAESDELKYSRLYLASQTADLLKTGLNILGINVVDKM